MQLTFGCLSNNIVLCKIVVTISCLFEFTANYKGSFGWNEDWMRNNRMLYRTQSGISPCYKNPFPVLRDMYGHSSEKT